MTGSNDNQSKAFYLLLAVAVIVNFSGLFVPILEPDGALYAGIARTMAETGNYVELFVEGRDWLDKPHFPFWITAFSFKVFGFTTWAYKLPAISFLLLGAFYTYRLAGAIYDQHIAQWATLILLTAQHIVISNNDVRAEPYLTGLIVASIYHFYQCIGKSSVAHLIGGSLFAACAVMTKGIFALIPIFLAIATEVIIKQSWREFFNPKWFLAVLLTLLFTFPELYCLYAQFDSHPEKMVFGARGVSGVRFFFWDSQFGRFLNTGPIKGKGDPTFFFHTTLWAFLPWSIMLAASIYNTIKTSVKNPKAIEWIIISAALPTFLLFSLSKFQLPHYINILFPFFSILTAVYIVNLRSVAAFRFLKVTQLILAFIYIVAAVGLVKIFDPADFKGIVLLIITVLLILCSLALLLTSDIKQRILTMTIAAAAIFNLVINGFIYPHIMKFQSGGEAAKYINQQRPGTQVVQLRGHSSYSMQFYLQAQVIYIDTLQQLSIINQRPLLLFIPEKDVKGLNAISIGRFPHFPISRLTGQFINKKTREQSLTHYTLFLLK